MNLPPTYHESTPYDQALWWLVRLEADDMDEEEHRAFQTWLINDTRNGDALAEATHDWFSFEESLTPEVRTRCAAVTEQQSWLRKGWSARPVKLAIAASLLAAVLTGWFAVRNTGVLPQSYATRTGQSRTVALTDGSIVYLNTRTQIKWLGERDERRVALLEGEALFDVISDAKHPFRVTVGRSEIRVLGTRFNVYRKTNGCVLVTVIEGSVAIEHAALDAGHPGWHRVLQKDQQLAYSATGKVRDVRQTDALRVIRWRDGTLDIKNEPLFTALNELARYTDRHILADDPRLKPLRVTAVLQVRDARKALTHLEQLAPITVTETGNVFRVAYHEAP